LLEVLDLAGRSISSLSYSAEAGSNQVALSEIAQNLKKGFYVLRLNNGSQAQVRKFVTAE